MSVPEPARVKAEEVDEEERRSSFAALRYRDFRLLWLGQLISGTGSQMQLVAINWHVYILTKSPLALRVVGLVRVVPIVACSLAGGVVADAVNSKRLMLVTQSVMLVSVALLALVTTSGLRSAWPLYLLTAISSAAGAVAALIGAQFSVITGGFGCLVAALLSFFYAASLKGYEGQGRRD